jgi:light-regulated signal transduction histidine kinase (bacteriophytochrome)
MYKDLESKVQERTNEVKEINKNLQQSNNDLLQFAHIASHDLKEPLRKIKTFAGRLRDDADTQFSSRGETFLSKVETSSEKLLMMIEDILNYSNINASENSVENVNLADILIDIESDLEVLIQQKNASINFDALPEIEGAPVLIHQLFYNLIHNSLKFSKPDAKQEIIIQSKLIRLENENFVQITLADRGIGFQTDESEKIFTTFTRLNAKEQYEGTGLGLTLCKKIVERHGGSITASGTRDQGAVFTIILPLKQKLNHI